MNLILLVLVEKLKSTKENLRKLSYYFCLLPYKPLEGFCSYPSGRTQFIRLKSFTSHPVLVTSGVPPGLSPGAPAIHHLPSPLSTDLSTKPNSTMREVDIRGFRLSKTIDYHFEQPVLQKNKKFGGQSDFVY